MFLQANLPPIELYVKKEYLYDLEKGHGELIEGLWVSVKSIQGRALYFETYLPEYGAVYDKLPISAFVWKKDYISDMKLEDLELWDCFSFNILNDLCCVGSSLNVVFSIFGSAEQLSIVNIYVPSCHTLPGL